jgi:hypothetical protein
MLTRRAAEILNSFAAGRERHRNLRHYVTSWLLADDGEVCSAAVAGDAPAKLPGKNRAMKIDLAWCIAAHPLIAVPPVLCESIRGYSGDNS